ACEADTFHRQFTSRDFMWRGHPARAFIEARAGRPRHEMRYVILHHEGFGEAHYDLMFESAPGSLLMTWRATDWPFAAGDVLTRIGDHRRDYLDYEGPVSNNRGQVRRVQSGTCQIASQSDQLTLHIDQPEPILILLKQKAGDRWVVV